MAARGAFVLPTPPRMSDGARGVRIRQVDPFADRERILGVLSRSLPAAAGAARQDWLYRHNPCGPALVWLAEDAETGQAVGTSAAQPRRVWVEGRDVLALNLSDFAVDAGYRFLGPALQLLRATLEPVRDGRFAFSYDHPNETMLAPYARVGGRVVAPMRRFVRVLDASPLLRRRLGGGVLTRVAGGVANAVLRVRDRLARPRSSHRFELLRGPFGDEFDRLDERLSRLAPVTGRRSAAHLRWRYGLHPVWPHETLCARDAGGLVGFAAFRFPPPGDVLAITELHAPAGGKLRAALVAELARIGRERGARALGTQALEGSPAAPVLRELGFSARETGTGPVVFHAPESALARFVDDPAAWWMLEGDRDV